MRILVGLMLVALVALALGIYEVKYETRALQAKAQALEAEIQKERDAIAVMRAEWSLLNRPDRIERLARKFLNMEPLPARQMISLDDLDVPGPRAERSTGAPPPPQARPAPGELVTH